MPVRKRTHNDLKDKHTKLQRDYAKAQDSLAAHQEVVKERDKAGRLLLDCLVLLNSITISKRQNSLIVERETLVERAKELGWLPGREEEQEEVVQS